MLVPLSAKNSAIYETRFRRMARKGRADGWSRCRRRLRAPRGRLGMMHPLTTSHLEDAMAARRVGGRVSDQRAQPDGQVVDGGAEPLADRGCSGGG
jgi:hypothetical protein